MGSKDQEMNLLSSMLRGVINKDIRNIGSREWCLLT